LLDIRLSVPYNGLPTIPCVQQIGKPIVHDARNRRITGRPTSRRARCHRRSKPNRDRAVIPGKAGSRHRRMQPALMSLTPMPKPDSASAPD